MKDAKLLWITLTICFTSLFSCILIVNDRVSKLSVQQTEISSCQDAEFKYSLKNELTRNGLTNVEVNVQYTISESLSESRYAFKTKVIPLSAKLCYVSLRASEGRFNTVTAYWKEQEKVFHKVLEFGEVK